MDLADPPSIKHRGIAGSFGSHDLAAGQLYAEGSRSARKACEPQRATPADLTQMKLITQDFPVRSVGTQRSRSKSCGLRARNLAQAWVIGRAALVRHESPLV